MKIELEGALERWSAAGLLSAEQAGRIRNYEVACAPRERTRLPVFLGLAMGGIMVAAGVLLFVGAHWDEMSPVERMLVLIAIVGLAHLAGAFSSSRFPATSATLHAVGTISLGGAIFLTAQIFNLEEHWPTGLLLWAAGALAGCLLGQWPQFALAALLVPAWLVGEWTEAASKSPDGFRIASFGVALLAVSYLTAPGVYNWIGGIAILPSVIAVALSRAVYLQNGEQDPYAPIGWILALVLPLAFAFFSRRQKSWINAVAALWLVMLSWMAQAGTGTALYAWCALGCVGLIAWGISESSPDRINLGMAGFALTVLFFFFSSVMNKLGRSASLIVLGLLFLCGGWYWEKLRRRLVTQTHIGEVE